MSNCFLCDKGISRSARMILNLRNCETRELFQLNIKYSKELEDLLRKNQNEPRRFIIINEGKTTEYELV